MKIHITGEILRCAQIRNSSHCMIAEAIKAAHRDALNVTVDLQTIRFTNRNTKKRYIYFTPRLAQLRLIQFDQGIPQEPFSFELRQAAQITDAAVRMHRKKPDDPKRPHRKTKPQSLKVPREGGAPIKIGGHAPPRAALSSDPLAPASPGARRAYGLQGLNR